MPLVYMITNKVNGKAYIGMTSRTLEARFRSHLAAVRQGSKFRFHNAIRKYGVDCWNLSILAEDSDLTTVRAIETEMIGLYRTTHKSCGYNAKPGGCGGWIVPERKYVDWHRKTKARNSGIGNGNSCGLTNEQLKDIVIVETKKLGFIPSHGHMVRTNKEFPKAFSKYRFDGKYKHLANIVAKELSLVYNGFIRTPEHREKLRQANLGKQSPNKGTRVQFIEGKRKHVKN